MSIGVIVPLLLIFGIVVAAYCFVKHLRKKNKESTLVEQHNAAVQQHKEEANRKRRRVTGNGSSIDRNISSHTQVIYDPTENDGVQPDAVLPLRDEPSHLVAF